MEVGLQACLLGVCALAYTISNLVARGWGGDGSVSVGVNSGRDARSPGVVKAPLAISSAQGLVSTVLGEVVIHVNSREMGVGPPCSGVEILLSEFPGSGLVGTEDLSVPVGECGPLVVSSSCVEGVTIPSLVNWVMEDWGVVW